MSEARIRVKIGDKEFDISGTEKFVLDNYSSLKKEIFESNLNDVSFQTSTSSSGKKELPKALATFITKKSPSTFNDKSLLISYCLEQKGIFPYNSDDINKGYSDARMKKPGNINDTMNNNQQKGFLLEVEEKDGKKAWRITVEGEQFIEEMG